MIRLTLTQMRLNAGRLAAAGLAVVLGTAFVAATLLASDLLKTTMHDAVSASYRGADVVVDGGDTIPPARLDRIRALPQVDGADYRDLTGVELAAGGRADSSLVQALPTTAALRTARAGSGRLPSAPGEVAVSKDLADRLRVAIGGQLVARTSTWTEGAAGPVEHRTPLTVVGLLTGARGFGLDPDAVATADQVTVWERQQGGTVGSSTLLVHAAANASPEQARDAVAALGGWGQATVLTGTEQADADTRRLTRDVDVLTAGLLAFAGIALFVAGLVITNTFQVLVAQRTRALALLRCVGATRRQIRRSVLLEAALLGTLASVTGLAVGTGLVSVLAAVLSRMDLRIAVPGVVTPSALSLVLPLVLGVTVTVLAAFSPARTATRVAPVAALRPQAPAALRSRASVLRLVLASVLLLGGGALLVGGWQLSARGHGTDGVLPAMGGGALSFLGILVGGSLFIPRLVGLVGRLVGRFGGAPARIAAANAVRNPRRTATTSMALLIGVTLVATMSTGAAVITATLDRQLDQRFPVDMVLGDEPGSPAADQPSTGAPLPAAVGPAVSRVTGVTATAALTGGQVQLSGGTAPAKESGADGTTAVAPRPVAGGGTDPGGTAAGSPSSWWVSVAAVDPAGAAAVVHDRAGITGLVPGQVVVPQGVADTTRVRSGDLLRLTAAGRTVQLRAVVTTLRWQGLLVLPADLRTVLPQAVPSVLWLHLDPAADTTSVVRSVQEAVVTAVGSQHAVQVSGAAMERSAYTQVIGTMLMIVTGLLAVAVVIALIGVANTLSLSVIERTRESAVLRALGLTRRQLRGMLAVEGALIAGIGALVGIGLGLVYGWAGAASIVSGVWSPAFTVPSGDLALLLLGGVLAGLLASALPARRAVRTPPVAALGD